jgi:hypothetical protein
MMMKRVAKVWYPFRAEGKGHGDPVSASGCGRDELLAIVSMTNDS